MDVIEGNGFLNMAMHTLVQDSQKNSINYPINETRPLTAAGGKVYSTAFLFTLICGILIPKRGFTKIYVVS